MKRVIYKKTGIVDKTTKEIPMLMFRSRERNKIITIGNSPTEVTDGEYEILKKGKYGDDITLYIKDRTKLPEPMEVIIKGSELKTKIMPKSKAKSKR